MGESAKGLAGAGEDRPDAVSATAYTGAPHGGFSALDGAGWREGSNS
jgi:hypothetical protein